MNVSFTPAFVEHMRKVADKQAMNAMFICTKRVGCNGLAYVFDPTVANVPDSSEIVEEVDGFQFIFAQDEKPIFEGSTFDYIRSGLNYKVIVNNPNAKNTCGCGESFNLA